jgi:DNA-binding FadR family transcriptional regulator
MTITRHADAKPLSDRQQLALELVHQYVAVAHELPSSGWLARRLSISRKRAWEHLESLRVKRWLDRSR